MTKELPDATGAIARIGDAWMAESRRRRGRLVALCLIVALGAAAFSIADAWAGGTEYSRDAFGRGWLDLDGDGFDTREEVLASSVISGRGWYGLYTGRLIDRPGQIDIDHVVPLAWAWTRGASDWVVEKRERFANDPLNLLVTFASANRSKGSRGPDEWMPANVAAWRAYLDRFEAVVRAYGLNLSPAEIARIACLRRLAVEHEVGIKVTRFEPCR